MRSGIFLEALELGFLVLEEEILNFYDMVQRGFVTRCRVKGFSKRIEVGFELLNTVVVFF